MSDVKTFLYGMYDVVVFPCWIVLFMCLIKMNKRYAVPLFVWACSLPVTLYCYVVYIVDGERPWDHWSVVALDVFAFSQLGWIGALLMTGGYLFDNERFEKAAFWTCVVSVVSHGLFLIIGLVWHVLSE